MTADFEAWLKAVFDHPVTDPAWYWEDSFDQEWEALGITTHSTVVYLTRLYRNPQLLAPYSLDQVAQAIWFLVGEASPAQPTDALLDPGIPIELRLDCIRATEHFFRAFVAAVAPGAADRNKDAFHTACFMWWDIFPVWREANAGPELKLACLDAMRACLELPSDLCQLSALHGLNHWHRHYAQEADAIVDAFLKNANLSAEVREYAAIARVGGWQ